MNGQPGSLARQLPAVPGSGARSATTARWRTASRTQTTLSSRNCWRSSTRLFASTGGWIFCSSSGAPGSIERSFSRCATWPDSPIERSHRKGTHGEKPRLASDSQGERPVISAHSSYIDRISPAAPFLNYLPRNPKPLPCSDSGSVDPNRSREKDRGRGQKHSSLEPSN